MSPATPATWLLAAVLLALLAVLVRGLWRRWQRQSRLAFVEGYRWPKGLLDELQRHYPALTFGQTQRVGEGLRQFFRVALVSGGQPVAMPSRVVDVLWHAFILHSRAYEHFCRQAFGRMLHHTPVAALRHGAREHNARLRRTWWWACKDEGIDARNPSRLPLLFALDGQLAIADGFAYRADCRGLRRPDDDGRPVHCGGDFAHSGWDGSTEGLGDGDGGSDGGADGGGDGGGD